MADPTPGNAAGYPFVDRHCRYLATHEPHLFDRDRGPNQGTFRCPGIPHDHGALCCSEHGHHVDPHVGCILR